VDVALHVVPAERLAGAGRRLEIDLVAGRDPGEGRAAERLGDGRDREGAVGDGGRGQAAAADRDRVAEAELSRGRGRVDLEAKRSGLILDGRYAAALSDDPGEHAVKATSARFRVPFVTVSAPTRADFLDKLVLG